MAIVEYQHAGVDVPSDLVLTEAENTLREYEERIDGIAADARLGVYALIRYARVELKNKTIPYAIIEEIQKHYGAAR